MMIQLHCMQAVASGCQVICLEESVPECPAAASFAATAALSGYALTMVSICVANPASCTPTSLLQCVHLMRFASAYMTMQVTGSGEHHDAGLQRRLSQQGSGKSLCKLYCMQAGQESLLAAAIIAPILFRETIFGLPRQHSAGKHAASTTYAGHLAHRCILS